jgi:hypothetical protein
MSRLFARAGVAAAAFAACATLAGELKHDVGTNDSPLYEKECGGCHFAYQPGWLPERSWRRLMGTLSNHFGENAEVAPATREAITAYLAGRAADRARNTRSREIMAAIGPTQTPISVTKVLYVGGIHGGFLDPNFRGKPEAKTLAQCPLCHQRAYRGWFAAVTYTVSDERFRTDDVDMSASLPVPQWMRMGK